MLTDDQIEAGLAYVLQQASRGIRNAIANSRPGELQEAIGFEIALRTRDVQKFKDGANSAGANL